MIPPPKIRRKKASNKATIFKYIPLFFAENAPIIVPIIARIITPQLPHPRNGIKQIIARIRVIIPQIFESKFIMIFVLKVNNGVKI